MAGNIIPAIATTNAIISGLIVLQALHLLKLKLKPSASSSSQLVPFTSPQKASSQAIGPSPELTHLRNVHIQFKPSVPLSTIRLSGPNPECGVCRDTYEVLRCDTARTTLGEVVKAIVGEASEDEDSKSNADVYGPKPGRGVEVYESQRLLSDPEWDDNLERTLESLNVTKGKFLSIVDEDGEWNTIALAVCDLP